MLKEIKNEFQTAPIATISALVGLPISLITLATAMLLFPAQRSFGENTQASAEATALSGSTSPYIALATIAFFFFVSISLSLLTRFMYRISGSIAVPFSIIIGAHSIFFVRYFYYLIGGTNSAAVAIDNLSSWGTVIVFLAIAGARPLADFLRPATKTNADAENSGGGTIGAVAILVLIWVTLVIAGQRELASAFLI